MSLKCDQCDGAGLTFERARVVDVGGSLRLECNNGHVLIQGVQRVSSVSGPRKLAGDVLRGAVGMLSKQLCSRCGRRARGLYWDGVTREYFCPKCVK